MSAQRYPNDFNGIAAGAPANNMDVQNTYHHANRLLTNQTTPGYIPLPQRNTYLLLQGNLPYIHAKVVAACDALDGVVDGIIDDPRACKFNTNTLVCANNGNEAGCLTQAQADAVFRIHDGAKSVDGVRLEPEIASEWGSELDWTLYMPAAQGGSAGPENFVNGWLLKTFLNDPYKDTNTKTTRTVDDLDWTITGFQKTVASSALYSATNPDLLPFAAAGGKLILWHGWADQHISPQGTIQYWESLNQTTGTVDGFARFYLFPGVGHCGGGLGPNTFDLLTPLMSWVETGPAPYAIVANNSSTGVSRPVYPYPMVARYTGSGSANDATNFSAYTPPTASDIKTTNAGDYLYSPTFPQAWCTALGTEIDCVDMTIIPSVLNLRTTAGLVTVVFGVGVGDVLNLTGWTVSNLKLAGVTALSSGVSSDGRTVVAAFSKAALASKLPTGTVTVPVSGSLARNGQQNQFQANTSVRVLR